MFSVCIPMAGTGTRAKTIKNKALTKIAGKPMFLYSYEAFKRFDCEIVLIAKESEIEEIKKYVSPDTKIVIGGSTRSESVYNGLKACSGEYVLVHDAARPFISENIINKVLDSLKKYNACYVGIPVKDTIRNKNERGVLNRSDLIAAQTPQAAKTKDLMECYEKSFKDGFVVTDDISVIEKYKSYDIDVIEGNDFNFKVTTPADFYTAEIIAKGVLSND